MMNDDVDDVDDVDDDDVDDDDEDDDDDDDYDDALFCCKDSLLHSRLSNTVAAQCSY